MSSSQPDSDLEFPRAQAGSRIGLFGGTFDPPHLGHVQLSLVALTKLKLDRIWWLVSPGNPLKEGEPSLTIAQRIARAKALIGSQRISVAAPEIKLGNSFTFNTIAAARERYPHVRFVWLMGSDNLAGFHNWERWGEIAGTVPMAIFNRPGMAFSEDWPAVEALANYRLDEADARNLADTPPPAWVFLASPSIDLSSSEIRGRRGIKAPAAS